MEITKHRLNRSLRLRDLVPMQIVLIVWLGWTGFAAKQGRSQIVLWLLAILLFYLPLAAVVMKLARAMPMEGGVYQWVKNGISPFAGYMAAWNFTLYAITAFAVVGSILADGFGQAAGPSTSWMLRSRWFAFGLTALACAIAYYFNVHGLRFAKWWSNIGSMLTVATSVAMLFLLIKAIAVGAAFVHGALSLAWPDFSIVTLSVFARMATGALSGFDSAAVFAEECRKPENDVARSVLVAAPLIALMYMLGTSTVLAYIEPAKVDVSAAVPQVMQAGFGASLLGKAIALAAASAFNIAYTAAMVITTGVTSRLPMVAGWDGLLPKWWSELHPKFRTPSKAVAAVAGSMLVLGGLSLVGADNQEAVQVGASVGIGSICIMYMLLFAVVLFGFRERAWRPGAAIRLGAFAAFSVAFVSLVFQIIPLGAVASRGLFALKVAAAIAALNLLGAFLYWRGSRRAESAAMHAADLAD